MSKPPPSYLDAKHTRQFTHDESQVFLAILMNGQDTVVPAADVEASISALFDDKITSSFNVQVMVKRLVAMRPDLSFSPKTALLCALLSDRVGVVVQWAYTLIDYERRHGKPMTFDLWTDNFPEGVPTPDEQERIWVAQKVSDDSGRSDNMLDGREAWAAAHTVLG